jgi:phospholipase C
MRALGKSRARMKALAVAAGLSLITGLSPRGYAFADPPTATPIEHLVVIFQENVSFDHYFATYPFAANTDGTTFNPADGTPSINGLGTLVGGAPTGVLLTNNPNKGNLANAPNNVNPFRLSHSQANTCDQNHEYVSEQMAFDLGLMDLFPATVGIGTVPSGCEDYGKGTGLVMGYYDGNTVTALWNYAQHFAMSGNSFDTTFGSSTPGALNLISGQTGGVIATANSPGPSEVIGTTVDGDPQPLGDKCSTRDQARLKGPNIGDRLNAIGVSWGFFQGGFDLSKINPNNGTTGCKRSHTGSDGNNKVDYIPHHEPFQYYTSTANLDHLRPSSIAMIEHTDAANHQYDSDDFFDALGAGNLPAVSFLKAPGYKDGHAGYSDPLLEQQFVVHAVNTIMTSKFWKSTAIIIAYDDSDGWYDHQMSPIVNSSFTTEDALSGPSKCGNGTPLKGGTPLNAIQRRCGYGPRQPLIVISPFAKENFVDHSTTDTTSILRFIEDNWGTPRIGGGSFDALAGSLTNMFDFGEEHGFGFGFGERRLILDPNTGN